MKAVIAQRYSVFWPLCVPLALPLIYGVLFQWTMVIGLLSFLAFIVLPMVFVALLLQTIGSARARRMARACVAGGAALLLLAQPVFPAIFWHPLYKAGLWVGLAPFYGHYKKQVAALPQDKGPRRLAVDLGYAGVIGHGLIFDESDQIAVARPPGQMPIGLVTDQQASPCDGDVIALWAGTITPASSPWRCSGSVRPVAGQHRKHQRE